MKRAHRWQVFFVLLMIASCAGMGAAIFGRPHNPGAVSAWAAVFGVGLAGQLVAALLRLRR